MRQCKLDFTFIARRSDRRYSSVWCSQVIVGFYLARLKNAFVTVFSTRVECHFFWWRTRFVPQIGFGRFSSQLACLFFIWGVDSAWLECLLVVAVKHFVRLSLCFFLLNRFFVQLRVQFCNCKYNVYRRCSCCLIYERVASTCWDGRGEAYPRNQIPWLPR